jgi:hypothetical protein
VFAHTTEQAVGAQRRYICEQARHGDIGDVLKAGVGISGQTRCSIDALIGSGAGHTHATTRLSVDAAALTLGAGVLGFIIFGLHGIYALYGVFGDDASLDGFAQRGLLYFCLARNN